MALHKLPPDAFALYASLGLERTYSAVAAHYGCSKQAVVKCAQREGWLARLADIEAAARKQFDTRMVETLTEIDDRHRKILKALSARTMRAIADHPIDDGMDAVRAASILIRLERLIMNQPTQHNALTVQAATKADLERYLVAQTATAEGDGEGDDDPEEHADW